MRAINQRQCYFSRGACVELRTTKCGTTMLVSGDLSDVLLVINCAVASRAINGMGKRIVVSGGQMRDASEISSKPITDNCCGMAMPKRCAT